MVNSQTSYLKNGLSASEVQKRLLQFGPNEIIAKKGHPILRMIVDQFASFIVAILAIAAIISISLGELVDGIAIFVILIINAIIGFIQEYKAENAVQALKKMIVQKTIVIRDGQQKEIPIQNLVPDDIILLYEGDKIPADMIILEAYSLKVDEAILTGESVPVGKKADSETENKLMKGTIVVTGKAKAKVVSTGMNTEFGKIVNLVSSQEKDRSPLNVQIDHLGKKLGIITILLVTILFIIGSLEKIPMLDMFMTSVALGVSAIPEGLPIIVTLTLAIGVQILASKKAIVRKMTAVETLGATTVICSDKTGTLTLNEMTVKKINTNFAEKEIDGIGYDWEEKVKIDSLEEKKLLEICNNCNNAFIGKTILGDPTEIALKIVAKKASHDEEYKKIDENTFTSERKMMSTLHQVGKSKEIFAKGAFEEIIKKCKYIAINGKIKPLTSSEKTRLNKINDQYSSEAMRVLAIAYKKYDKNFTEEDMIFVGMAAMIDPPRKTVKLSIEIAHKAGIKVKIITGDNPLTAKAIGEKIGLESHRIITGEEIDKMTDRQLIKVLKEVSIFARTKPQHKYRLVDLLKKQNEVVAVTGDGVNDAPALKHADVGIAMGIKGTEATKEVADMVLKDDNFSTIVNTINEGRRIYENILSFLKYMLSVNFVDIVTVGLIALMKFPLPLLPLQILWINIATDALPALALGTTEARPNIMEDKPRPKRENIFRKFLYFILVAVILKVIGNLTVYFYGMEIDLANNVDLTQMDIPSHARTMVFTGIVLFELVFAFVCIGNKAPSFKAMISNKKLIGAGLISLIMQIIVIYTPFMQKVFKTTPLSITEWGILFMLACSAFLVYPTLNLTKKLFKN
ncbi:MAG: cation-translocating P-type ATPase [Candidatus Gracilibacteria bacterium]|nr:cation-translocating P-type ATPase [Candidatus Gracilibacteria bacterium]